ncbi:MAG TPA: glycine cleavage system aminomethyltransferase GcvT [Planctomycetaceae bacterium]|nr:glycine cleavage system aminomethyltransferase GcvT [Planctomycetaceae bacterium]
MEDGLRQSPLHEAHVAAGARMVPFAGWNMPVQYQGIIPECEAVRENLGVFDISHMGQIVVGSHEPLAAVEWLDSVLTNNVSTLKAGEGQYSFLLNHDGGVIDDLIIYRTSYSEFLLVVNASRTQQDFDWLTEQLPDAGIIMADRSNAFAGLAVQGPGTEEACRKLFPEGTTLPDRFCMAMEAVHGGEVIVCRTGYTGEDGVELFCPVENADRWWNRVIEAGATPCGLGARDSLRLEKCYPLNGSDLTPAHTPLEAGMGFAVDLNKPSFIGRDVLAAQKSDGMTRRLVAIRQTEKSPPPRPGYEVFCKDEQVGTVCSGGASPTLKCGISLAWVQTGAHKTGTAVELEIRGRRFPGEIVRKPFV